MKLAVLSLRNLDRRIFWRNVAPPLEDALASLPGGTLVVPPALRRGSLLASCPAWLNAIRTVRRADMVFWLQLHLRPPTPLWALAYLRPLAKRSVLAVDSFEPAIPSLGRILDAQRVTVTFTVYSQAARALRLSHPHLSVKWLPLGFNRAGFRDLGIERDLDVYWMGRRHEPLHAALLRHAESGAISYSYSRSPGDPKTTEELNRIISRSRYFVVTPPDLDDPLRTGSFSPVTSRYLEGLGAGARLLGVSPRSGELERIVPDVELVQCAADGSDLAEVLAKADADAGWERKRIAARDLVHAEHSWDQRAVTVHRQLIAAMETEAAT